MNEIVLKGEEATQDAKHTHTGKMSMSSKKGKNGFKPMLRIRTEKSSMTKTHKGKSKRVTPFSPAAEPPRRSIEKAIMDSPTYTVVEVVRMEILLSLENCRADFSFQSPHQ